MATEQIHDDATQDESFDSALSALTDGELTPQQLDKLLSASVDSVAHFSAWRSYQVIGDVLRGDDVDEQQSPQDFLAGVRAGMASPFDVLPARPKLPVLPLVLPQVRGEAANDAVLRWKRVAGLASLAAVMAVSWVLVRGLDAPGVAAAPQLAQTPAGSPLDETRRSVASGQESNRSSLVVVNTDQGRLIRDSRLEQMLAEHRQYGAMSALQMPAGFLRNATYDDSPDQ